MHPIMSDHDIAVRQFELCQHRNSVQQQLLAREVARRNGRLGPLGRLADTLRAFIDPRGHALRQFRLTDLQRGTTGCMQLPLTTGTAQLHTFPTIDRGPMRRPLRKAA